ncbi:outer membrane protein transport protein [Sulfuricurvum sp.]|uniref:OmpP1/FadL family transporter n=1 Tax=Sulfuricurvum sp. TaxID=2025608 RepID=UPI0019C78486|nr:outer membrane protein transport protein [Sulfuricurvum sp.]MBD3807020.1 outer membrane protein transport protein [Sulfuricurvum sp.]
MKKTIKLAVVAALALGATSAFATNGDHLIGLGAKARGMGGTGIGMGHGAESALANPAMITSVKSTKVSFGGTIFMPKVSYEMKATDTAMGPGAMPAGTVMADGDSASDMNMIPEVSIASKVTDNFYAGVGMWGTAGMGVDYRGLGGMEMVTNLQLMQFGVPLAYKVSGFSVGITPILQYGALDINYKYDSDADGATDSTSGEGVAQDLAFGYTLGAAYEMSGLTLGLVYKSPIEMDYKGQLSTATAPFVGFGIFPAAMSDKLEQPAEIGVGASYVMDEHTIAIDYKQIKWSSAKGYKEFNWDDQDVVAIGYEYATKGWALRAGYNYASQPIKDAGAIQANSSMTPTDYAGNALNTFNLLGFPATVESHITLGGTYDISETTSLDVAYVYAPETSTTLETMAYDTDGNPANGTSGGSETTVKQSQNSVSVQINYAF